MRTDISSRTDILKELPYETIINKTVETSLDYTGCPFDISVDIVIADSEFVKQYNKEFRGKNITTDVLSFPNLVYNSPGNFESVIDIEQSKDPETGLLMIGSILINAELVIRQAKDYGHSADRELAFLTAHSMLHLFGFDHIEENERKCMEDMQEEILKKAGYTRGMNGYASF